MYIIGHKNMSRKYYINIVILGFYTLVITPIYSINKISVSGTVEHIEGGLLAEAQLTLMGQKKSATTNRFGEFDLGKVFPNDTLLVKLDGFQYRYLILDSEMKIKLYPKSKIQDLINNARNGETITIPSGIHYIYPDFNIDSTVGMTINYKTDITITGNKGSEIRLRWSNADIIYIHESNNITIKNLTIGYYDPYKNSHNTITTIDSAKNFDNAFGIARRQLGKNSIFKYKGKLYHTNSSKEPAGNIIPGKAVNIYNSYDVYIDSIRIFGKNNICMNAKNSRNIQILNSEVNEGLYGFVFNKCSNIKIDNSLIADNSEILYNKKAQIDLTENTIKIAGNYVPEFVLVNGGSIEMIDESIIPPPKPAYLSAKSFNISRTEITFKQFDAFCISTKRGLPDDSEWGRGDRPVINIKYEDAQAYCNWLTGLLGKSIKLPSVDEWEYAARGGTIGGDDKFYSGGNNIEDVSWCKFNSNDRSQPVGLKIANELGIYDMSGNVYEFCSGIQDSMIILKGGSWANSGVGCRVSDHVVSKVDFWDDNIGFRCIESEL
jgi:hypothetical protein